MVICDWGMSPSVERIAAKAYESEFHEPFRLCSNGFFNLCSYYERRPQLWPAKYQLLWKEQKKVPKEAPPVMKEKDNKVVSFEDFKNAALDYAVKNSSR